MFRCGDSLVLRFHPDEAERARLVAELTRRLAAAGAPVAAAVPSFDGRLVVPDAESGYAAHAHEAVQGWQVGGDGVTSARSRAWGQGLARLHQAAEQLDAPLAVPSWIDVVEGASGAIATQLRGLPTGTGVAGIVHGDPELDNVLWRDEDEPVFVDLDDASHSWFAADVCFALRDFAQPGRAPDSEREPVSSFLAGYRDVRPLADEELSWLPLFARAHAAVTLVGLEQTVAEPAAEDWPPWAYALRQRVEATARSLSAALAMEGAALA